MQQGERFVITRPNRPVAQLIPYRQWDTARIRGAIDGLKEFQWSLVGVDAALGVPACYWRAPFPPLPGGYDTCEAAG